MTEPSRTQRQGGCICGAVRFETTGDPRGMSVCHCRWCQRRTGTAFGTEVIFRAEDVRMLGVEPAHYRHRSDESGRWLDVYFCPTCGTNVGLTLELVPGVRTVPAGAYDDPAWLDDCRLRELHVFTRSRRRWADASPHAEVHEGYHRGK
jgi:hypothetical protein